MCSIFGYYKLLPESVANDSFAEVALSSMRHRGPDAEMHIEIDDLCMLGHQRLSIIDIDKEANQPMKNNAGDCIAFNGEIYNYIELRHEMKESGSFFGTKSDTEVLLRGIENCGTHFLNSTNGMFAFAFYSLTDQRLILARDRFGVKPLHYTVEDDVLYFSSEIKPLLQIKKNKKRNLKIYDSFIRDLATDYNQDTFIDEVYQVPKGSFLVVSNGECRIEKWYHGNDFAFDASIFVDEDATISFVEDLLTDAIDKRLRSDVPVCITLSGGVDSTVIYTLIKDNLKKNIQPYTYIHPGSATDEFHKVAKLIGGYNEIACCVASNDDFVIRDLKEAMHYLEFPAWNPSSVAYMDMYSNIKQGGYKVVIEGHASDELLGGYSYVIRSAIFEYLKRFNLRKAKQVLAVLNETNNKNIAKKITIFRLIGVYIRNMIRGEEYNKSFQHGIDRLFDYKILPIVLRVFDRITMRSSVESRAPFMDYRVVEVMKALPMKYKISEIGNKAILREILKRHDKDFIYKDKAKMGFASDLPKIFNDPEIRVLFSQAVSDFKLKDRYPKLVAKAQSVLSQQSIGWAETDALWKVASLSMIDRAYDLDS